VSIVDLATVARHLRDTPKILRDVSPRWTQAQAEGSPRAWHLLSSYLQGASDASPRCSVIRDALQTLYDVAECHYFDAIEAQRRAAGWHKPQGAQA
jgi:hypothetical protein